MTDATSDDSIPQDVFVTAASASLGLMQSVFRGSSVPMMITDANRRIVDVNPAFESLSGYSLAELVGLDPHVLASHRTASDTYRFMWECLRQQGYWQGELWDKHKNGQLYPIWVSIREFRDAQGTLQNYFASYLDISDRKAMAAQMLDLVQLDALTRLPNRVALQEQLIQLVNAATHTGKPLTVMLLGLDRFKSLNESSGHDMGDELLKQLAQRLRLSTRSQDVIARLGGDEFVVVLPDIGQVNLLIDVADRLLATLAQPFQLGSQHYVIATSIGISCFPEHGSSAEILLKNADLAMYQAKHAGGHCYRFFDLVNRNLKVEQISLEQDLRQAILKQQFQLYFQPQINVRTGQVNGVEALIRWLHPDRGWVSPLVFIPIAEQCGFILELGDWVLQQACLQLQRFAEQGLKHIHIAVNLSARQFSQKSLLSHLRQLLQLSDVSPERLELEITESVTMSDPEGAIAIMHALRDLGIKLSIDDFGTGYSSLVYLKRFPVSALKIDRSFVQDIGLDSNDAAICHATVALAHSLGLDVVAEGVETEAQLNYLKRLNCNFIQGFYYSKPLPAEQIVSYILERNTQAAEYQRPFKINHIMVIDDDASICDYFQQVLEFMEYQVTTVMDPMQSLELVSQQPDAYQMFFVDLVLPGMSGLDLVGRLRSINQTAPIVVSTAYKREDTRKTFASFYQCYHLLPEQNFFILEKPLTAEDIWKVLDQVAAAGAADLAP